MAIIRFLTCFVLVFFQYTTAAEEIKPDASISIPMRDGASLPADVYLPSPDAKNLPCILIRSPAGRQANSAKIYIPLAKEGYVVIIQDTRSVLDTEGKTLPYWSDGWGQLQDGYDTVEWLAKNPYTNGKIGTAGFSALGITQLLLAPTAPEALKCQHIGVAASSLYHHAIFPGGQLLKNQVEGWLGLYAKDPSVKNFVSAQATNMDFWNGFNSNIVADKVKVPALHYGGWYDTFLQGTIDSYIARNENGGPGAKGQQKLLIGPWTHHWPALTKLGDFEVPAAGKTPPIDGTAQYWFDYYLKGIHNGLDKMPAVTYYVMGPFDGTQSSGNVWRHADKWPVPALNTTFYLTDDHKLAEKKPAKQASLSYQHDHENPVATQGGRNLFIESGPKDQRQIEERKDVLVFTSTPMTEDTEITGRILSKIFVTADHAHCDVVMRLTDVYPDGRSILIADGLAHVCETKPSPDEANPTPETKPKEVLVDLWSTSIVIAKGHSIRISISGSNYPRFEKVDMAGKDPAKINAKIFIGSETPSEITLPIVRKGDKWLAKQAAL